MADTDPNDYNYTGIKVVPLLEQALHGAGGKAASLRTLYMLTNAMLAAASGGSVHDVTQLVKQMK